MFSMRHYEAVVEAYLEALEERLARGRDVKGVSSVASFFVSRVDTMCDKLLDEKIEGAGDEAAKQRLAGLRGRIGVANSKLVYERFDELFSASRGQKLAAAGAQRQRLLWASTGTKNPAYSDVIYVDQLIGPNTINTMPEPTLDAFRDHGVVRRTVDADVRQARAALGALATAGIDLLQVGDDPQADGVRLFDEAYNGVVRTVEQKRTRFLGAVG